MLNLTLFSFIHSGVLYKKKKGDLVDAFRPLFDLGATRELNLTRFSRVVGDVKGSFSAFVLLF